MKEEEKAALKQATRELISRVNEVHRAGGGSLPLSGMVALFAIPNTPRGLSERGDVVLAPRDDSGGTFANQGEPLQFEAQGIAIEVPASLRGDYEVSEHRLALRFDPNAAITGRKLFVRATLKEVIADQSGIDFAIQGPIPLPATKVRFD